jgi:hypothetical protein
MDVKVVHSPACAGAWCILLGCISRGDFRTRVDDLVSQHINELGLEKDDKASLIGAYTAKWEPKKDAAPEEVRK